MLEQVIQAFLNDWTRADTVRLFVEFTPLFLPLAVWGAVPYLRRSGDALLVCFSLFTALHLLFRSYGLVFEGANTAARLSWAASPFVLKLGFFHAASAVGLLLCLALRKAEWTKGLLTVLIFYATSSAVIHLAEAFGRGRIGLEHLGPHVMHDILFSLLALWVLRKAGDRGRTIYYVPK